MGRGPARPRRERVDGLRTGERRPGAGVVQGGRRPYLVVSNEDRPFFGDEYTVAVITTTPREAAVELTAESFVEGRLDRYPRYVDPWSLHVFQHDGVDRRVGQLDASAIEAVADGIDEFVRPVA